MARRKTALEKGLERLAELRRQGPSETAKEELQAFLGGHNPHLAGRAGRLIGEWGIGDLAEDLERAFEWFQQDSLKRDPGCVAKTPLARAMATLELPVYSLYLWGLRHIQMEPAFGKPVDTAGELRAWSARGLVQTLYPGAVNEIVRLLLDAEPPVRLAAARALGASGRPEAEPALRLKVLLGDAEPEVLTECLAALLELSPRRSLDLARELLETANTDGFAALALALGESRGDEAVRLLLEHWPATDPERRRSLALALAASRRSAAFELLLEEVTHAAPSVVRDVIPAMAIHRHDPQLVDRLRQALDRRPRDLGLEKLFRRELG